MSNEITLEEVVQKAPIDVCIRILAREIDKIKKKEEKQNDN